MGDGGRPDAEISRHTREVLGSLSGLVTPGGLQENLFCQNFPSEWFSFTVSQGNSGIQLASGLGDPSWRIRRVLHLASTLGGEVLTQTPAAALPCSAHLRVTAA